MATILTKRSNTASSVPVAGDLTNSTGGAELAVNTADKRLFTKDSGGTVVELGTNPSSITLASGTANAVPYLNGSKVLTTGSALTFDGTSFGVGTASLSGLAQRTIDLNAAANSALVFKAADTTFAYLYADNSANEFRIYGGASKNLTFYANAAEQMRLTSTGLGIGTSSPSSFSGYTTVSVNNATNGGIYNILVNGTETARLQAYSGIFNVAAKGASTNLTFETNGTERLRIDSSGNLGLGVTPSAWSTKAFQVDTNGTALSSVNGTDLVFSAYYNAGWKYQNSTYAPTWYSQASGQHRWYTAPSGTAGNAISFTQAMTLDANGRLLVGTTTAGGYITAFDNTSAANTVGRFVQANSGSATNGALQAVSAVTGGSALDVGHWNQVAGNWVQRWYGNVGRGANDNVSAGTFLAGLDALGNLLVGTTSASPGNARGMVYNLSERVLSLWHDTANAGTWYESFFYNGTNTGRIERTGATTVAYTTSSDYRLKHDIQPMTGALAKVAALKPVTYKWNVDGSDGEGFIAHELQAVVPACVTGEKDAVDAEGKPVYQGIDTSFLAGLYAAALQELMAEVNSLKAEIQTLKGN